MLVKKHLGAIAHELLALSGMNGAGRYLVGGAVRDTLLGKKPREYDFVFTENVGTFLQRNPQTRKVGKATTVFLVNGQEYMPITGTLEQDLARRDLTINALALDSEGFLFASEQALYDLEHAILRPISAESLRADPLRVFRLARFACELPDFSVHPDALVHMRAAQPLLAALAPERVCKEFMKALASPQPSRWLTVLQDGGCLSPWFSFFSKADAIPAGPLPFHDDSVLHHTHTVMDTVAGDPLCVWMGMCHDLGKLLTPEHEFPHHYGHELRGVALAGELARKLSLPAQFEKAGKVAAELHMKAGMYDRLRPGTQCRLLMQVHAAGLDDPFWRMAEADSGRTLRPQVAADLEVVLHVSLPPAWRNRGEASGVQLLGLRSQALAASRRG